jgi:acyl homoserine lactone synthase/acyl-homoserine lactone synthase
MREITRFCIDPLLHRGERRLARNQLVTSLVLHARREAITTYTAVANVPWFEQIMRFGWDCRELGPGMRCGGEELVALQIRIDDDTLPALRQSGIYADASYMASGEPGVVS